MTDVSSTSATLHAEINPEGESDVTYRFEYDTSALGASVGGGEVTLEADVSASVTAVRVSAHVQGLSPATVYHYRVVAQAPGANKPIAGEEGTFTTRGTGGVFALPDGRLWEPVSPQNKRGAGIEPINIAGGDIQSSADGDAFTYVTIGATESEPAGNTALEYSQIFSTRRSSGGWESKDIATPHDAIAELRSGERTEYLFFSNDLSRGLVDPKGETPLPPLEEGAEKTLYLRNGFTCASQPGSCFLPLVTKSNVQSGALIAGHHGVHFVGSTPDLSHVVLESEEALTANAVKSAGSYQNLYDWSGGQLQLVSILPPPKAVAAAAENESTGLGYKSRLVRNAISNDGSRIVWETENQGDHHLYLRDMTKGETVQLDVPQPGVTPNPGTFGPIFQGANDNDSRVFFTDEQRLTPNSRAELREPDLYVFELNGDGSLSGTLTDLTVDERSGESAAVQGAVVGASEDGTYVYFVADGALAEHAVSGNCNANGMSSELCNLYMVHYNGDRWERPVLVAVLSGEDEADWQTASGDSGFLGIITSHVSPNGEYLAFMSDRSLTGYDNRDTNSGVPDEEVYLYHALHGSLVCASCDPGGGRPVGVFDPPFNQGMPPLLVDHVGALGRRWLAGSVPGWTPISDTQALYQSRYLSNDGRLFFDSPDTLVSADTNGEENVYEYEPVGVGSCNSASASASDVFDAETGGCVALISSGTSSEESAFLDASEEGGDVFFLTRQELSAEDIDSAFDVYDAHECTERSPCASVRVPSPPCTTAESCRGTAGAQPSIFGAAGSATFSGAGNLLPSAGESGVASRSAMRAQKLAGALRACRRRRGRQRAACIRRAEKRYGTSVKRASKSGKRGK